MDDPREAPPDITGLLHLLAQEDRAALSDLAPLVYDELRTQAQLVLGRPSPGESVAATELVHEVFLRLARGKSVMWRDRRHFFAVAAGIMRRALVDRARARRREKRGRGAEGLVASRIPVGDRAMEVVELDELLTSLEELNPRHARIAELRIFGGLSLPEVASVVGVSLRTVEGDWRLAKTWLRHEYERGRAR